MRAKLAGKEIIDTRPRRKEEGDFSRNWKREEGRSERFKVKRSCQAP